jgi:hypothetical protein
MCVLLCLLWPSSALIRILFTSQLGLTQIVERKMRRNICNQPPHSFAPIPWGRRVGANE